MEKGECSFKALIKQDNVFCISRDRDEIEAALTEKRLHWLDILYPNKESNKWLRKNFHFHPLALADLLNNKVRPKQEFYGETLFTVFPGINLNPGENPLDTINLNAFLHENILVTTHVLPLRSVEGTFDYIESRLDNFHKEADYIFYRIVDTMIDRYFAVMDQIEDDIEDIEKRIFERPDKEVQKDIFSMKRKVAKLKRSIAPKREALRSLVYSDMKQISSETRIYLRDVLDHVMRIDENIDSYRDLISGLMDAYMTQISNNMNATMALLSIIATIMLPLSLLTGVFGMNFEYIPGLKIKWGFWALVGVMLIISIVLIFIFRKKKML